MKNAIFQYSEMEQMVREVTSNSKEEPQEVLMRELAKGTFTVDLGGILSHIWRRLAVKSNPHHPYKCLILLEYLLREGNTERIMQELESDGSRKLARIEELRYFACASEARYGDALGSQSESAKVRLRAARFLKFINNDNDDDLD